MTLKAGIEIGAEGSPVGRDPRQMTPAELTELGHAPMSALKALRAKCLDCCCGSAHEVRLCVATDCPSWPFRMGKSPWRPKLSDAERERRAKQAQRAREAYDSARSGDGTG